MLQRWYVHKFINGRWVSVNTFRETFDAVDKLVARMETMHGPRGWTYVISATDARPECAERPLGIS